jgi:predicted dienelactone hydrolase
MQYHAKLMLFWYRLCKTRGEKMILCKSSITGMVRGFVSLSLFVGFVPMFFCEPVIAQANSQGAGREVLQSSRAERFAKLQQMMQAKQANFAANSNNPNIIISLQDWIDPKRKRKIPIKIYQPKCDGPWAVVIFSHGLGGSREAAGYFGEAMAENGYLSMHLQHPGSDSSVWMDALKDGRISLKPGSQQNGRQGLKQNLMKEMRQAMTGENLRARVDDVKFVLDQPEKLNSSAGAWHQKLDMTKIGCSGHSFGAGTTMAIAGQTFGIGAQKINVADPRVKAAIYMSAPVNLAGRDPKNIYGAIKIPGMHMTGTKDNSPINNNTAADRLIPYKNINAPDQYQVNFNGGDHAIFGGTQARRAGKRDQAKDAQYHVLINKLSVAFFDAYLKGDAKQKQWLKQSAEAYLGSQAKLEYK